MISPPAETQERLRPVPEDYLRAEDNPVAEPVSNVADSVTSLQQQEPSSSIRSDEGQVRDQVDIPSSTENLEGQKSGGDYPRGEDNRAEPIDLTHHDESITEREDSAGACKTVFDGIASPMNEILVELENPTDDDSEKIDYGEYLDEDASNMESGQVPSSPS
jgi:hypothetical protein